MTPLKFVDLRASIDEVYNQSDTAACGPHAIVNALDTVYDNLGQSRRFSRFHLWWWARVIAGTAGVNTGTTFESLSDAINVYGMLDESACPWGNRPTTVPGVGEKGFQLVRTFASDIRYREVKHLLCMGVPVVWLMKVTEAFYDRSKDGKPWRTHDMALDLDRQFAMHFVTIQGYDDDAGRWLVENSWGPEWGDGGFFGVPYDKFQSLTEGVMHFNMMPVHPKAVEGYSVTPYLNSIESSAFVQRSKAPLKEAVAEAAQAGPQSIIDCAVRWGLSDKHLEMLFTLPRGEVRKFKVDHPDLDWSKLTFDQL